MHFLVRYLLIDLLSWCRFRKPAPTLQIYESREWLTGAQSVCVCIDQCVCMISVYDQCVYRSVSVYRSVCVSISVCVWISVCV